jgi:hypothetical protein
VYVDSLCRAKIFLTSDAVQRMVQNHSEPQSQKLSKGIASKLRTKYARLDCRRRDCPAAG